MTSLLHTAERKKAKLRIGLSGPSGSGKTYSALLLASGMAPWDKIALLDTENGSGELYAHLGPYMVGRIDAPYTPEKYIEAIKECERAGAEVIVIDSTSHEWDGKGGCLEINELIAKTKFRGNTWSAWSETTPRHQHFIEAITTSPCHIITTARSKTETIQTEDKKIKKVGMKDIQREGFEYELTSSFNIDRDKHYAVASKDRTGIFIDLDPFVITAETGKTFLQWANSGAEPAPVVQVTSPIASPSQATGVVESSNKVAENAINKLKKQIKDLADTLNPTLKTSNDYAVFVMEKTGFELSNALMHKMIVTRLETLVKQQAEQEAKDIASLDSWSQPPVDPGIVH